MQLAVSAGSYRARRRLEESESKRECGSMDSEPSSPSPPDVVAEDEGHLERTDAGKTLDCVGDDVVQRFTAGERSGELAGG